VTRRKKAARRPPATRGRAPRPGVVVLGVVGLAVVLGAVALLAGGSDDPGPNGSTGFDVSTATVSVSGERLAPLEGDTDPAIGVQAPEVSGSSFDGSPISIGDDGRPKAILFLAHWCPHCQREVPAVQALLDEQGPPEGVDLYSVATAIDPGQPNYPPQAWLDREGWSVPVLVDDGAGTAAEAYGLTGFPFWVFVDASGEVVLRVSGELGPERLEPILEQLLAG
jgi:cytochrome c biogenesis protein CcmG/thiol:disulfide interchange protein DsbE